MVDRSMLSQDVSSVITYTPLYYPSEVCRKNKWYTIGEGIISSFILLLTNIRKIFAGIDSTGFKITHASQYFYTEGTETRRKNMRNYLSIGADVLQQIIYVQLR